MGSDFAYRYLKVANNAGIIKLCNYTDSIYEMNGDSIRMQVENEESRLIRQAEDLRLAGEKEREARILKEKARRTYIFDKAR